MMLSVVIPAYNEAKNVRLLYDSLKSVIENLTDNYEILFVDDGSKDSTFEEIEKLRSKNGNVKILKFRKNFGQTAALDAGFKHSAGDYVITMDCDLQNDPKDIPLLLKKLSEGYDVVSGWRYKRKDPLSKKVFSKFANFLRRSLTKEKIHDSGCTLKIYKKSCLNELALYGEMHRYITTLLTLKGFKVGEVKVTHHQRLYGKTKYTFKRVFKGFFDLMFIKFWNDFSTRPLHFFGYLGFLQFGLAFVIFIEQLIKAFIIKALNLGPLLIFVVLLMITGSLTFLFGFLAEIMIRTYYKDSQNYVIEKKLL